MAPPSARRPRHGLPTAHYVGIRHVAKTTDDVARTQQGRRAVKRRGAIKGWRASQGRRAAKRWRATHRWPQGFNNQHFHGRIN